jgi:hypothetical protein
MEVGDWITLAAVIVALGIGVASILHTQSLQKRERKERLLNEIIEWAVDVLECEPEVSTDSLQAGVTDQSVVVAFIRVDLFLKYRKVDARSEYVRRIALNFEKGLQSAVKKATGELDTTVEFLRAHLDIATTQEVRDYRESLELSALAVIKEATNIKARDIGKKEESMAKEGEATESNEITMKDIEKHLIRIEGHIIQSEKKAKARAVSSFGLASMTAGIALVSTGVQITGGLTLFGVGLILTLYSFYFM